jgi:hypothetical protein
LWKIFIINAQHWKAKRLRKNFFGAGSLPICTLDGENGAGMRHFCAKNGEKRETGQKQAIDMTSNFIV